jgi:hypothetical protein
MSHQRCGSGWRRIEIARLGVGLFLVAGSLGAAGLTLVENGAPRAVILVEAEPVKPASEAPDPKKKKVEPPLSKNQRAARAIQVYIAKMSGATLPIIEEGQPVEGSPAVQILVGHTEAARKLGVKIPGGFNPAIRPEIFEEEGYVLKTRGTVLIVAGNNDGPYQGTLYAAYALLDKLGCRWYFPGEWGEVVPESATVTVPELDVLARPDFAIRTAGTAQAYKDDWCTKVGFSAPEVGYPTAGDGYLAMLLPPAEYAEAHPEYYAMDKGGKRTFNAGKSGEYFTMLCLSNPDVTTASVERVKAAFAAIEAGTRRPGGFIGARGVGISPPDGMPFCYCEACLAASQNFRFPGYFPERMMSEEYCGFAVKITQAFPDKFVALSAYSLREVPPQGVVLPPNIAVNVFPISTCVLHSGVDPGCWRRQETMKIAAGWRKLTPHVVMQHYAPGLLSVYGAGQRALIPERDVPLIAAEAALLKKMGLKGITGAAWVQGGTAFMQTWLSYYVRAKLTWDVATDVAALKKEFYTTFFGGSAGPHVQAWWDACEDALGRSTCHAHEDWVAVRHVYTVSFAESVRVHVAAALKAEATVAQRGRLEAFALIADHLEAYAAMNEAESRLDYPGAVAASERMAEAVRLLNAIYPFFGSVKLPEAQTRELQKVAVRAGGTNGVSVAALPLEMKFARDRFNEGVLAEWYDPDFDDSKWGVKNTFLTWDQQDSPEDAKGHDYDGYGWYRAEVVIPKHVAGKPLRLFLGGVLNEGWIWINGRYAGHKPHQLWWNYPAVADLDVAGVVKPGQANTVVIRVWNDAEIGGLYRRGFFYLPAGRE